MHDSHIQTQLEKVFAGIGLKYYTELHYIFPKSADWQKTTKNPKVAFTFSKSIIINT